MLKDYDHNLARLDAGLFQRLGINAGGAYQLSVCDGLILFLAVQQVYSSLLWDIPVGFFQHRGEIFHLM